MRSATHLLVMVLSIKFKSLAYNLHCDLSHALPPLDSVLSPQWRVLQSHKIFTA
jgi:hypothetical protein